MFKLFAKMASADMVSKSILALISIILIKFLSVDEYSKFTISLTALAVIHQISVGLLDRILIVHTRIFRKNNNYQTLLLFYYGIAIIGFITLIFLKKIINIHDIIFIFLFLISSVRFQTKRSVAQSRLNFRYYSISDLIRTFFTGVAILIIILTTEINANLALLAFAIGFISINLIPNNQLSSQQKKFKLNQIRWKSVLIFGLNQKWLFIFVLNTSLFIYIPVYFLEVLKSSHDISEYGAAYRYYLIYTSFLTVANAYLLPKIQTSNSLQVNQILKEYDRYLFIGCPVLIVATLLLAPYLISIIQGQKYPNTAIILTILSAQAFISLYCTPRINILLKAKSFKYLSKISFISLIILILMSYIFIINYGSIGAAIASLIGYSVMNLLIIVGARKMTRS